MCGITGIFDTRGAARDRPRVLVADERVAAPSRPRRGAACTSSPASGSATGACRSSTCRPGSSRSTTRTAASCVVFNGEIYNYQELIPELTALGHTFRTRSDTEVIVHAWEAWGEACVERFRGMFAFALWDRNRETLFLARDRLGVKPLHYALLRRRHAAVRLGAEVAARASAASRATSTRCAVEEYFALGYVAEPRTIFRDARKLPPAHTLAHPPRRSRCREPREYWDVRFTLRQHDRASTTPATSSTRGCDESVRLRMISEVPLGAFLSGGVDSSAVVATMAGLSATPVNTCSIAFADPAFDESALRADRSPTRYRHAITTSSASRATTST